MTWVNEMIIDSCCIAVVFDVSNKNHADFEPVRKCILTGRGFVVYGGTKYKRELADMPRYVQLFLELERSRKTIRVSDERVDAEEKRAARLCSDPEFNDAHLVALVNVSRCRLVCTSDRPAVRFLKMPIFYESKNDRPRIYSGPRNAELLKNRKLVERCVRAAANR